MNTSNNNLFKKPGNRTGMKNIEKWKKDLMTKWILEHKDNPYPSEDIKEQIALATQLTKKQVSNWFTNARKRHSSMMDESKLLRRKKRRSISEIPELSFGASYQVAPTVQVQTPLHHEWDASLQNFSMDLEHYCCCNIKEDLEIMKMNCEQKQVKPTGAFPKDIFSLL